MVILTGVKWYIIVVLICISLIIEASLVAQTVRNPPGLQETWVWVLGWEDPLEKGMPTHSSILAQRIQGGAWQATVHGVTKSKTQLSD